MLIVLLAHLRGMPSGPLAILRQPDIVALQETGSKFSI
jgi:hypothetical protein